MRLMYSLRLIMLIDFFLREKIVKNK